MDKKYINEADYLISLLLDIYKVSTISELAKLLGVKQQTISSWKIRNSIRAIEKIIAKHDLTEKINQKYNTDIQFIDRIKGIDALNFGTQKHQIIEDNHGQVAETIEGDQKLNPINEFEFNELIKKRLKTISTLLNQDNIDSFEKCLKNWIVNNL